MQKKNKLFRTMTTLGLSLLLGHNSPILSNAGALSTKNQTTKVPEQQIDSQYQKKIESGSKFPNGLEFNKSAEINPREYLPKRLIILDPGHGGIDTGATIEGISEDEVAYDITVRVRQLLLQEGYSVHQTVYDRKTKFTPLEKLVSNREEFLVDGRGVKTKLTRRFLGKRCQIINNFYDQQDEPILVSIHVNSLYFFVQGACIYYPSEKTYGSEETEKRSKKLAEAVKTSLKEHNIPTYSIDFLGFELDFLPDTKNFDNFRLAIFKTRLEDKILVECGNLQNGNDQRRLLDPREREKMAVAIYKGISSYVQQQ